MIANEYNPFFEFSTEGIYKLGFDNPIDVTTDEKKQIEKIIENASLSDCNNSIAGLLGYSDKNKLKELKLNKIWNTNPIQKQEVISKFINSGYQMINLETVEVNGYGKKRYYSNNFTGVIENGTLTEVWGNMRDITELKTTVDTLLKINECYIEKANQLQNFNREIEKILYKITHDLNSPLSNIEGLINIIKLNGCYESEEVKPLIDLMSTAVSKFKSTIKDVAKVPSVEHEKLTFQNKVNFDKVWERALKPYEEIVERDELKITSTFEVISADINPTMLYSIFHGMLGYAIKNRNEDKPLDVFLKTYQDDNYLVLETKQTFDMGINLSEQLEELQEVGDDPTMDLFLVGKIAESNGGKLEFKTFPRKSTTLKVFLKV